MSGRRDEKKGILLNYITHYISWLSSDEGAGQDYRNMIFLQKWQALDGGVYMWSDPFLVRTENKMGIVYQKLPLLLIDALTRGWDKCCSHLRALHEDGCLLTRRHC